ncbi:MAG: hypothetical protein HKL80_01545 [Acidimicrobiales bacterium]|nr:hypothetical protein [Acidimicrobiales bacterium]
MSRIVKRLLALVCTACLLTSLLWAASTIERPGVARAISPGWAVEGQTNLNPTNFTSVSCPSTQVCYAVDLSGTSAEILKTQDLGATWASSPIPLPPDLKRAQVSCVSVTECYALFNLYSRTPSGANSTTAFFATTDSGNTWKEESSPGSQGPNYLQLSCTGPGVCIAATYLFGSTPFVSLAETTDGGIVWTQSNLPISSYSDNFMAFSCTSSTQCIFLSASPYYLSYSSGSWSASLATGNAYLETGSCAVGSNYCVGFGSNSSNVPGLFTSTDGGKSWVDQPATNGYNFSQISCYSATSCFAIDYDGGSIRVAQTSDGVTWTVTYVLPISGITPESFSCYSTSCMLVGDNSSFEPIAIVSSNGGSTWTNVGVLTSNTVSTLNSESCVSVLCIAAGGNSVEVSTDSGSSWSLTTLPSNLSDAQFNSVSCPSALACYIAGSLSGSPLVISSFDGGNTWTSQILSIPITGITSSSLISISCPDSSGCLVVGNFTGPSLNGSVAFSTSNSGVNWNYSSSFEANGLNSVNSISCPAIGDCWVTWGSENVFATTDNGMTWTSLFISSGSTYPATVTDGLCPTVTKCYFIDTTNNQVIPLNNGSQLGHAITIAPSTLEAGSVAMSCPSSSACFIVLNAKYPGASPSSEIVSTTDGGNSFQVGLGPGQISGIPFAQFASISCITITQCQIIGESYDQVFLGLNVTNPSVPTSVVATPTALGAQISWTAPASDGGMGIGSYVVTGTNLTAGTVIGSTQVSGSPPSTTTAFTGLIPGDLYSFSVVAKNSYYSSPPSQASTPALIPPAITSISPNIGPTSGGTVVTITGVGFSGVTGVVFGGGVYGGKSISFTVINSTTISAVSPPYVSSIVGFELINAGGYSQIVTADQFQYYDSNQPVVSSVTPNISPLSGGRQVSIYGANFNGATQINIGSTAISNFTVVSNNEITIVAPPMLTAQVDDVSVVTPNGSSLGWNPDHLTFQDGGSYTPVKLTRIVDTRRGASDPSTYASQTLGLGSNPETLNVPVVGAGSDQVPAGATAVVLNITALSPSNSGYLTVYPGGEPIPGTSTLNFSSGEYAVANMVEIGLGVGGSIEITNFTGSVDVLVDVEGYISVPNSTTSPGLYNSLDPIRIADTRMGATDPPTYAGQTLSAGGTDVFQVDGMGSNVNGLPQNNVSAVVVNLTVTNVTSDGFATIYADGTSMPDGSTLNMIPGNVVTNRSIVPVGSDGMIDVFCNVGCDLIVDISGWFTGNLPGSTGDLFVPTTPTREADSRPNSGLWDANTLFGFYGGSQGGLSYPINLEILTRDSSLPSNTDAVVLNVTVTDVWGPGYLTLWPYDYPVPQTSDMNWSSGQTVANLAIAKLGSPYGVGVPDVSMAANMETMTVVDVTGYYVPVL